MDMAKILIKHKLFPILVCLSLLGCGNCAYDSAQSVNSNLSVRTENLYATVEYMTNIQPARNHQNINSLNKAASYIEDKFYAYGFSPYEQNYDVNGLTYKNIIASYGPEEAPRFIVGAHYDVYGDLPGADDNASGVAGLLELARLFRSVKPELKHRIDFVAFSLEEPPFFRSEKMGSYIHAKGLYDNNAELIGMASLEMIGFYTDAPNSQTYPLEQMKSHYPSTGNFIAVVGNLNSSDLVRHFASCMNSSALKVESLKAPAGVHGVDLSDHMNYWKFNYNALMITDTSFFRNSNYHKRTDTIETLDFNKMAQVVKGLYVALSKLRYQIRPV